MKKLICSICLALALLGAAGVALTGCQPCNDPSQLFCPGE